MNTNATDTDQRNEPASTGSACVDVEGFLDRARDLATSAVAALSYSNRQEAQEAIHLLHCASAQIGLAFLACRALREGQPGSAPAHGEAARDGEAPQVS